MLNSDGLRVVRLIIIKINGGCDDIIIIFIGFVESSNYDIVGVVF